MRGLETKNALLANLPSPSRRELLSKARFVSHKTNDALYSPHIGISQIVFPTEGLISLTIPVAGDPDRDVELALIGAEGVLGVPLMYGVDNPRTTATVRAPTYSVVLDARTFKEQVVQNRAFAKAIHTYAYTFVEGLYVSSACALCHHIGQRCARWLLMAQDRLESNTYALTHEALARSLSVRRASVTASITKLQRTGAIRFSRGMVTIADRKRLEQLVCDCYRNHPFGASLSAARSGRERASIGH